MHTTFSVGASISNPTRWKCSHNIIVDTFARCAVVGFYFAESSTAYAKCTSLFQRLLLYFKFRSFIIFQVERIQVWDTFLLTMVISSVEITKGFGFTYQKSITSFYYHTSVWNRMLSFGRQTYLLEPFQMTILLNFGMLLMPWDSCVSTTWMLSPHGQVPFTVQGCCPWSRT